MNVSRQLRFLPMYPANVGCFLYLLVKWLTVNENDSLTRALWLPYLCTSDKNKILSLHFEKECHVLLVVWKKVPHLAPWYFLNYVSLH